MLSDICALQVMHLWYLHKHTHVHKQSSNCENIGKMEEKEDPSQNKMWTLYSGVNVWHGCRFTGPTTPRQLRDILEPCLFYEGTVLDFSYIRWENKQFDSYVGTILYFSRVEKAHESNMFRRPLKKLM